MHFGGYLLIQRSYPCETVAVVRRIRPCTPLINGNKVWAYAIVPLVF